MRRIAERVVRLWPLVLVAWGLLVLAAATLAPPFDQVATFDDAAFLPPGSATARGDDLLADGWPDDDFANTAVVALVRGDEPLGEEDEAYARDLVEWIEAERPGAIDRVTTHLRNPALVDSLTSSDGHAWLLVAGLDAPPYSPPAFAGVGALREHIADTQPPEGLDVYVTGSAAVALDEDEAIDVSVQRTTVLTVVLVVALLLYIFRSPVAALVPLVTVGSAYVVAVAVVGLLARAGLQVSYLYETFAVVIVFGAGTDYSLLAMSRYDEELAAGGGGPGRRGGTPGVRPGGATLVATMAVLGGVLASSAASTIVGFSAQGVARFGLFRTMGPALAVSIALTLVAGLTLTPALMRAFGRFLYWPRRSGPGEEEAVAEQVEVVDLEPPAEADQEVVGR